MKRKYTSELEDQKFKKSRLIYQPDQAEEIVAIEEAFIEPNSISLLLLEQTLEYPLNMASVTSLLRHLNLYFQKNEPLDDIIENTLSRLIEYAFSGLENQLAQASSVDSAFSTWLSFQPSDARGQFIAFIIYNCGQIAESRLNVPSISASSLIFLLQELERLPELRSKALANIMCGISLLAKANKLKGSIDASVVDALLSKLLELQDLDTQGISNSLNSLGLLAAKGHLQGVIHAKGLQALLRKLPKLRDLDTQGICNSLYGIGLLSVAGKLQGDIYAEDLQYLLRELLWLRDLDAQGISDSLYGINMLAKAGQLQGVIDAKDLAPLLSALPELRDFNAQCISNCLYSIGCLAKAGGLQGVIHAEKLQALLGELPRMQDFNFQSISNSLYGLGLLASARLLQGVIHAEKIKNLLGILSKSKDIIPQHIGNSLYGLGLLASAGQLRGVLHATDLETLLGTLSVLQNTTSQNICNSLHGLGLLAKAGQCKGVIATETLQRLLTGLQNFKLTAIGASQALGGLTQLKPYLTSEFSAEALTVVKQLIVTSLNRSYQHPSQAAELINAIIAFKAYQDEEMNRLFIDAAEALSLPLELFPLRLQNQLKANFADLSEHPVWQERLGQQLGLIPSPVMAIVIDNPAVFPDELPTACAQPIKPLPPRKPIKAYEQRLVKVSSTGAATPYQQACRDELFNAIDKKNEQNIRRLLQLKTEGLAKLQGPKPSKIGATVTGQAERSKAPKFYLKEQLVLDLFNITNKQALRELIVKSEARFFILLLQACSGHTRYQLVKSHGLHPLLINMPLRELTSLIPTLISPFQIYRDHKALLGLIDALTIRIAKSGSKEQVIVKQIQLNLVAEGLSFHLKCQHSHVSSRLYSIQTKLKENCLLLLDVNEETDAIPTSAPSNALSSDKPVEPQSLVAANKTQTLQDPIITALQAKEVGVNLDYEYETEDIQAILAARVKAYPKAHVLAASQMNLLLEGNRVVDVLTDFFQKQGDILRLNNENCTLLLPIQDGEHWLGLAITLQGTSIQSISYFNSINQGIVDNQRMRTLQGQLHQAKLINPTVGVMPAQRVMLQCDGTSCGPMMVENFYCALKNQWWLKENNQTITEEDTKLIRQRHLDVLMQHRPDYYQVFKTRQANNAITVPDLAVQLQTHGIFSISTRQEQKGLKDRQNAVDSVEKNKHHLNS